MARLVTFMSILLIIDILFIMTGQICSQGACSLGSLIFQTAINLQDGVNMQLFTQLIGSIDNIFSSSTGFAALIASVGAVTAGLVFRQSDTILFLPIAITFAIMANDFVFIYAYLASISQQIALLIMGPMFAIYIITVVEWLRGKD